MFALAFFSILSISSITAASFHAPVMRSTAARKRLTCSHGILGGLSDLWEEVIEFSTLGPGERKIKRDRERVLSDQTVKRRGSGLMDDDEWLDEFQRVKVAIAESPSSSDLSLDAFNTALALESIPEAPNEFGGYELRDLLVEKWNAPLDISFTRVGAGSRLFVYCNIMPVPFGSRRCQHRSQIDYLMHLQGVVEILDRHSNLEPFIDFIKETEKRPRSGTFVPYQLQLTPEQLNRINGV
mmetsp:Transcript_19688/g.57208  ORF Transcript_19688/g.57208 Transcript_19688/m.57208 type:complete len:240 (-) Transcript_19688:221-940(-)